MNNSHHKNIKIMGVINITPDSFSDGKKYLNLDKIKVFVSELKKIKDDGHDVIFDIGAESTAPFNEKISRDEEWSRIEKWLLPLIDSGLFRGETLSIDTYKPEIIERVSKAIYLDTNSHNSNPVHETNIIWNDVSGVVDQRTIAILNKYPKMRYVLCHNLANARDLTSDHMDFVDEKLSLDSFKDFFLKRLELFKEQNICLNRVILDPCFGFSKTLSQNHKLLKDFRDFISIHENWLIGISRKSFLKAISNKEDSEFFHHLILSNWIRGFEGQELICRVHDQKIFNYAIKSQVFLG